MPRLEVVLWGHRKNQTWPMAKHPGIVSSINYHKARSLKLGRPTPPYLQPQLQGHVEQGAVSTTVRGGGNLECILGQFEDEGGRMDVLLYCFQDCSEPQSIPYRYQEKGQGQGQGLL